jgi:hypothetical protein
MCVESGALIHNLPSTALDDPLSLSESPTVLPTPMSIGCNKYEPVVGLQYEPSVLLTLADPRNLHDSDGPGAGKPHVYTYDLLSAIAFYRIFCEDCVVLPAPYPRVSFALRTLRRG